MKNIKVEVGGESIDVRPPYHWNRDVTVTEPVLDPVTGEPELDDKGRPKRQPVIDEKTGEPKKKPHPIKQAALDARKKNPKVAKLLKETFRGENKEFGVGATVGKATPEQMQKFLEESLKEGLIKGLDKEGLTAAQKGKIMKDYLDEYGVSTDCSGLMVQALNFLEEGNMERSANETVPIKSTKGIAGFPKVKKPADLRAGDAMVISGSHVRLITDVDVEKDGVYFTTLESTTGRISKELGSGVRELRWRFPNGQERKNLEIQKNGKFELAKTKEQQYIYTRHETLSEDEE